MDIDTDNPPTPVTTDPPAAQPAKPAVLYARFDRSFGFEFAMFVFFWPPLVVLWGFVAYYYYLSGALSFPILKVAVYYSAAFVVARFLYGNNRAARRGMGVVLEGERIVNKSGGGVKLLECADIRGVRCTKNPLFNKKMVVALETGEAALPLNLRGSYKMVETIFEKLAAVGQVKEEGGKTAAARRRLYTTALQYNALYKLRGRYMPDFATAAAGAALFNGVVAILYWERGLADALAWGFAGMLFQALGYLAAERFWTWRTFDRADNGRGINGVNDRDNYDLFRKIHTAAATAALLLTMVAGIAVTLPAM
jgi:hypothetical protein